MASAVGTSRSGHRIVGPWTRVGFWVFVIFLVVIIVGRVAPFFQGSLIKDNESEPQQTARALGLSMYAYAQDHGGRYPDGKSSTEVFQKLLDGQYVSDPAYFYSKMAGKKQATSQHLLPENVSWDVTMPVDVKSADEIPVIFCTGFRIEYKPGGSAVPLAGQSRPYSCGDGITVCYHSLSSFYRNYAKDEPGVVKNFIPADAKLGPNGYTQLTPDGPLPAP